MPGQFWCRAVSVLAISGLLSVFSSIAHAQIRFDLPAQPLAQALTTLGSLANVNIVFDAPSVDGIQAPALNAKLSADDALAKLLAGTRLHAVRVDENTFRVVASTESKNAQTTRDPATGSSYSPPGKVHLASAAGGGSEAEVNSSGSRSDDYDASHATARNVSQREGMEQVLVSAQKRQERLQDVPVPVTALGVSDLVDSNQVRIQDYYTSVPGLNMTPTDYGGPQLNIRGLTTGGSTSPTVGVVIDDVPYGASTGLASGGDVPDLDPADLKRIEVLRGPQGTLYGAGSMGGLLKFVTIDPSTDMVSGHVDASANGVKNGNEAGYAFRGSVNVPLSDTVALRASGFTRRDPGYVDNPVTHLDGINKETLYGGRLSTLWRPSEVFSVKLNALVQHRDLNGSSDVDIPTAKYPQTAGLGDLQQNQLRGTGWYINNVQFYSATLTGKIGAAELTSLTGYDINEVHRSLDASTIYGSTAAKLFGAGVTGSSIAISPSTRKISQELRLAMPLGEHVDWLFGGFYNHENSKPSSESLFAINPATGAVAGTIVDIPFPSTFTEYAAFTDFTLHFTDRLDLQLGARESRNEQVYQQSDYGPLVKGQIIGPVIHSQENAFTYLVTPSFKISPDVMVYARMASGYRPGGPNFNSAIYGLPETYNHDTTQNYEMGTKGDFLNHLLSIDASVYYIGWKDVQLQLYDPRVGNYYSNAGRAKSQGEELSVELRPLSGLTLAAWATWDDAVLTQSFPKNSPAVAASGDRLPDSSRFSGHFSVDDEFPITGVVAGSVGAAVSYVGNREGVFGTTAAPLRQYFPAYARTDLRAGVTYESWKLALFANNIFDKRGVLNGGIGTYLPFAFQYIQPRTVGISVDKTF